MKFLYTSFFSLVCFFSIPSFAQFDVNNLSVELGYGYTGAVGPYSTIFNSNFSGMRHYDLGIRYMFSETIGAKVFYKVDSFVNDPGGKIGITYNTIGGSFVYNVGKEFGLTYFTRDRIGLLTHLDGGVSFSRVIDTRIIEKVGIVGLGITPMCTLSDKLVLYSDFTYNWNLKQHYGFDGMLLNADYTPEPGSFYNFSIGLIYYIGENKYHNDWY